jgi:anti-anti-sigma factor
MNRELVVRQQDRLPMPPNEQFELFIKSRPENLSRVAEFISQVAQELNLSDKEAFAISMAVDEACTNIMEYAYAGNPEGQIHITCEQAGDDCCVAIRDQGEPFDPASVPEPNLEAPLEEREAGGLGIFFMRQLMDEVQFQFDPQEGNVLAMVRHRRLVRHRPARTDARVTTVEVRGRLDAALAVDLDVELQRLADEGQHRLIVDFAEVRYISSSGLRILLMALKRARRAGGDLKLISLAPKVLQVFYLAGFHQLFEMYEDEAHAVRAFNTQKAASSEQ